MAYAAYWMCTSQTSQATPKPAAQVSDVKPAQFETSSAGAAMATKPGGVTAATGGAAGKVTVGAAGKETNTTPAGATVIDMSSAGAAVVNMASTGVRDGPKQMSKSPLASGVKTSSGAGAATAAAAAGTAAVSKAPTKDTAKSAAAATTVQADPPKASKPAAAGTGVSVQGKKEQAKPAQTKVQVEVPAAAATGTKQAPADDPFDALASILPSADSIARPEPVYTGPEVKERDATSAKAQKCGEREDTLPPDYRWKNMPPAPADAKPQDVPKPLNTDQALDSLSAGFMTSTTPAATKTQEKKESFVSASAAASNFAPPPGKKSEPPVVVSPAPPADKKAKMEDFSLAAGLAPTPYKKSTTPAAVSAAPPADKKAKVEKADAKAKTNEDASISLDALSALGDTLAKPEPKPEPVELRPEDIVAEDKLKKEKGVRVGEREDTLPPGYSFNEEELKKLPAPKPEPTMGTGEALDFLSGGFMAPSTAPAQKAEVPAFVPPVAVCRAPPADIKATDCFSLEAGLSSSTAKKVEAGIPPMAVCPPATDEGDSMSLDALGALGGTLPKAQPKPEPAKLRPEDIVSEDKHKKEKGVRVGERDDTLPPEYRFNEEELKKLPAPKPEPTISTGDALDFLSGGFDLSAKAPAVQAAVTPAAAPPAQAKVEDLSALDLLSGELVSSTKSAGVQAPLPPPSKKAPEKTVCPLQQQSRSFDVLDPHGKPIKPKTDESDPLSLDALGALGDTLAKPEPKPEPAKLRPEDIVSEDKHKKKKGVLVGERDDTIPTDYRFNEEELKKLPAPKPEPTISTGDALDFLSGGFDSPSAAPAVQAPVVSASAPPVQASADFALDALAGEFVSSTAAPAVKSAATMGAGADDAMDLLSDTLKDIKPAPQPAPVPLKNIVKEDKVKEERLIKMGERDDSLPPEYRPTEEDLKKMAEAKPAPKEKTMDDKTALDLLSSGFSTAPVTPGQVSASAATAQLECAAGESQPQKPMAAPVLDSLADTLIPNTPEFKAKADKPKKHHAADASAVDDLSAQLSSDVVPASTKRGSKS